MKYGLTAATISKMHDVLANYPQVEKAIIYGSRAVGNQAIGSDIDLTLIGGEELTLQVHHQIDTELDELLLPYTIDLSILQNINNRQLVEHIESVGKVFYEKQT